MNDHKNLTAYIFTDVKAGFCKMDNFNSGVHTYKTACDVLNHLFDTGNDVVVYECNRFDAAHYVGFFRMVEDDKGYHITIVADDDDFKDYANKFDDWFNYFGVRYYAL